VANLTFDIDSLTIEEVEILEDVTDKTLGEIFVTDAKGKTKMAPGVKVGKLLRAIAYIEGRRGDPNYTLEMAGKVVLNEERPTQAGGTSQGASPASSPSSPSPRRQASRSRT
jgi:hypothetical protein